VKEHRPFRVAAWIALVVLAGYLFLFVSPDAA